MANVDDFWRQLNAKKASRASLSGLGSVPGLTTHSRVLPSKPSTSPAPAPTPAPTPASASPQVAFALPDQQGLQVRPSSLTSRGAPETRPSKACDEVQASVQRDINCLKDQDRTLRRNAVSVLLVIRVMLAY